MPPRRYRVVEFDNEPTITHGLVHAGRSGVIACKEEDSGVLADMSIAAATRAVAGRVQSAFVSLAIACGFAVVLVPLLLALLRRWLVRPIKGLADAAGAVAQGNLAQSVAVTNADEIGDLQRAFNQMVTSLAARTADLERALTDLQESATAQTQLHATVLALSTPVVPVLEGIVVMPLIGVIDTTRADQLTSALLQATAEYRAHLVILDLTGVPMMDTQVAHVLLTAARAVKLLGAHTILVGLRTELAQSMVGLELDLADLITRASLQSAIEEVVRQRGVG